MDKRDRIALIEQAMAEMSATLESAGIWVGAEREGVEVTLVGEVDSPENRQAALDVAQATIGRAGGRIIDAIETPASLAEASIDEELTAASPDQATDDVDASPDRRRRVFEVESEFTGHIGATDAMVAAEEGIPWFPPTDPVVAPTGDDRGLDIVNGFAPTGDDAAWEPSNAPAPDFQLADRITRALADDALTSGLPISVAVRNGVAHLRGVVPTLDDAENAEAVVAGIGGVTFVTDDLRVATFIERP